MASRSTLRTWIRTLLGADADDPAFSDDVLNPIVQQAADSIVSAILRTNPGYLSKTATLLPDAGSRRTYTFATQSTPVTDFGHWLEVRYDNDDGLQLTEARLDELRDAGPDYFAITGPDEAAVLVTSPGSRGAAPIWIRYGYWPAPMTDDNAAPGGIPERFHDVVALEALFAFGLGGEQAKPRELHDRWIDRKAELLAHVSRRGVQPSRTRVYLDPMGF